MMALTHSVHSPQMQFVHAYDSPSLFSRRQPAQYICTGPLDGAAELLVAGLAELNNGELSDGVVSELGFMMWNCEPVESAEL